MYVWPEVTSFFPCLLPPLPTSGCEFYWMVLCCICVHVWEEVTCFSSCLLASLWMSGCELYLLYMYVRSNLFLSMSAHSIANIRWWVLLKGHVLCMFWCSTRGNLFLSLSVLSNAYISRWVLLNGLLLCMCDCLNRSNLFFLLVSSFHYQHQKVSLYWMGVFGCLTKGNLFFSLSVFSIANISKWVLVNEWPCVVYVWIFDQK